MIIIMNTRIIVYAFACLSFCIVIGGAVYEHMAVVPQWAAGPPLSLQLFQGPHGLNPTPFWKMIHPVTLLLLAVSLLLFRRTGASPFLISSMAGYVIILVITFSFFVPELVAITGTPFAGSVDPDLQARAQRWERLSLVRLSALIVLAIALLSGMAFSGDRKMPHTSGASAL